MPSHFCAPISRGPVAEGENLWTPREKPCRAETYPEEVGKEGDL